MLRGCLPRLLGFIPGIARFRSGCCPVSFRESSGLTPIFEHCCGKHEALLKPFCALLNRLSVLHSIAVAIMTGQAVGRFFSRPKNDSTSLQNSLFEHSSKVEVLLKGEKAQLRSDAAPLFLWSLRTSRSQRSHIAVMVAVAMVTTQSLRGYCGHLCGHYGLRSAVINYFTLRSLRGHSTWSLRGHCGLCGHYRHYAIRKSTVRG